MAKHILIIGPSGSGKTYISAALRKQGINAPDADLIESLSGWFGASGKQTTYPENADKEFLDNHEFLWDRNFLSKFLQEQQGDIYLFGMSGNVFDIIDLFDKVYFLKTSSEILAQRLRHESRENPMGKTDYQLQNALNWAKEIEDKSRNLSIEMIDANRTPEQIFSQISGEQNLFRTEGERKVILTSNEREKILQIDPSFQSISGAEYFDNYDLPCPIRVSVTTKDNRIVTVVLRKNRHGDVRKEIQIIRALKEFGLPVPEILSEPFETEDGEHAAVYSFLPGENLQKLSMRSEEDLDLAKELLVQAVIRLMDATEFIKNHEVAKILPSITLSAELEALNTEGNPWLGEKNYQDASQKLQKILPDIKTPLVLSNGDYQPGNFLAQDGKITGYLDFESPSFQDPMMGFVKYPIYDLDPLGKTDVVKVFLDRKGFSEVDFNYRLALGCLKILKKEIPVSGGEEENQEYRKRVLDILNKSLDF